MRALMAAVLCVGVLAPPGPARARLVELRVLAEEPFADGAAFGAAGPYVRLRALARGELDPRDPANAGIAGLAEAPRNARGGVEYDTDVFILRPADPARGSGVLLYDVTNRGNKFLMSWLNGAPEPDGGSVNDPRTAADAGNGFTFRRGYTTVWSGWQPEVSAAGNRMGIRVPVVTSGGALVVRRIRTEIVAGTRGPERVETTPLPYPVASADPARARLAVRARQDDPRTELPPAAWEFVGGNAVRLLPPGTPFVPRHIYDLWYDATAPRVVGIGFAATRDVVAFLRGGGADGAGHPNPAGPPGSVRHAIGFGVSLSGRFLRHFLELGMNRDETGGRVFDGVLAHISGAGKVFGNEAFAMPFRTATQHEDRFFPENWFPYGTATAADPSTGRQGSLLRGDGSDPLVIETNTSTEYWQKGASLIHTDPVTGDDLPLPATVRAFLIAGTQHAGRPAAAASPGFCANARNPHDPSPALRALLADLDAWVRDGTPPPGSRVPHRSDGSAVPAASVRFPAVPGVTWPPGDNPVGAPVDWVDPPAAPVRPMPTLVAALDADGNERAGLLLPDVAVPLGTFTGTNVYRDLSSELCDRDGTAVPFARTRAEREARGDPRPSLAERYGTRDAYAARVRQAASELVAARLLLPEDAERYVAAAAKGDPF